MECSSFRGVRRRETICPATGSLVCWERATAVCGSELAAAWRDGKTASSPFTPIAQELHDTLLQGILSAMQLHVAESQIPANSPAKALDRRVLELMEQVIIEGRGAVRGLRLSKEGPLDLEQALSRVPQELAGEESAINFRVIAEGAPRTLHPIVRDEVYRIGREAVTNAFRHSHATRIEVELNIIPTNCGS